MTERRGEPIMNKFQRLLNNNAKSVLVIIVICFVFAGCNQNDSIIEADEAKEIVVDEIDVDMNVTSEGESSAIECEILDVKDIQEYVDISSSNNDDIEIFDSIFHRSEQNQLYDVEIHYPQVSNYSMDNRDIVDKINQTIYDYVMLDEYSEWTGRRCNDYLSYTISYMDDDYMSIIFEGWHNEFNHEKGATALNFDLKTGEIIKLCDYVNVEQLLNAVNNNINLIHDEEMLFAVGGKDGVLSFLNQMDVNEDIYCWAITDEGISVFVRWELSNGKEGEYVIVDIYYPNI